MASPLPPPLAVETALCSGEVHDQGAQVTRWAPAGAAPVLYVSTAATLETGRSIRGGVPVCWPWFGPGRGGGMEPAHGFVRTAPWHLVGQEAEGEDVVVTHRVSSAEVSAANWPHAYDLELRTRFGTALELTLTTTNTGEEHYVVEEALHAYLAVGDVRQVTLDGLDGRSFFDKVTGAERVQSGPVRFSGRDRLGVPHERAGRPRRPRARPAARRLDRGCGQRRRLEPLGREGGRGRRHR